MKVAWLVVLLTVALSAQAPQSAPGQAAPAAAAAKGLIEGRVVNSVTGEPVKKAAVILAGSTGRAQAQSTTTNEQGQFSFRSVEPGSYRLLAIRTGYVRQGFGDRDSSSFMSAAGGGGSAITVRPGQEIKDILFRLVPSGAISGRVVDQDGEAMMGVGVQALRWNYFRGRRQLMPASSAPTNDRGEYRIFGLSPGRYYLCATYEGGYVSGYMFGITGNRDEGQVQEAYTAMFYPGTTDPSQAAPVDLRGGDDIPGINLMMSPQRTVGVSGRVFNSVSGQVGRGVHVQLMGRTLTMRAFVSGDHDTMTDEQGGFRFRGVLPGSYVAIAQWDGEGQGPGTVVTSSGGQRTVQYNRRHYTGRQAVEVGTSDVEGVNLVIASGTDVVGSVRFEGTLPTTGRQGSLRVILEATDDLSIGNIAAGVNPDNTFTVPNVPDDTYRVNVSGLPEGAYLKAARMNNQDVLEDGLVMTRGRRGPLDLVISTAAGTLVGNVLDSDGKPFLGARVVLVPEGGRRKVATLYRTATSDQYGRFNIRSVTPGDYKLFAWDTVESGAWQDPDFLRPFEDFGQVVHITEGSQSSADVKVIATENKGQ